MASDWPPAGGAAEKTARLRLATVLNDLRAVSDDALNFAGMRSRVRPGLAVLLGFHIVTCCLSLIYVGIFYAGYHIVWFDQARLYAAALSVTPFAIVAVLFASSRFSIGYFVGFYFYTMILGYLWLAAFSQFHYDHTMASVSAFVSALALLAPALFITLPIRQRFVLSARALDHLLSLILIFGTAIIAIGAYYNFRLVGIDDIYSFRGGLKFPVLLNYAIGATSNALLPFAFACFVSRGDPWRATAALLLLLLFYPIMLTKLALFAPFWLLFIALLSRFFEARTTVVLSLLLPLSAGVIATLLFKSGLLPSAYFTSYFGAINFRMIAFPSIAIDLYDDFFSAHDLTYFCQISFLKPLVNCPYSEALAVVMAKAYQVGNLNASLFATEGIASVGPLLAPLAVFVCGLVIALGNRLSAGLPHRFILISGALLPHILLNVALTITLLTYGAAALFLLWYVTPRAMFEQPLRSPSPHPSCQQQA
jgi:hypothetical protein